MQEVNLILRGPMEIMRRRMNKQLKKLSIPYSEESKAAKKKENEAGRIKRQRILLAWQVETISRLQKIISRIKTTPARM